MKTRKHPILDHPILGYFILLILGMIILSLGSVIDNAIAGFLPGYGQEGTVLGTPVNTASGAGMAIGAIAAAMLFKLWFRPDFKGMLRKEYLKEGLLMLLPFLLIHWAGSVVSWITFGVGNVFIAFLRASAPGFGEEVIYRGLGVANYMRVIKSDSQIKIIFWLSSIVFGLSHAANVLAGGDPFSVVIQTIYATGVGMLLGAVYLRTGNLWPTMLGHMSVDFLEFVRKDLEASGGIMLGMGIGDWITIAAGAFAAVWGLRLIAPKYYSDIMKIWDERWSRDSGNASSDTSY